MTETSRFWGGTATGDATTAPYDAESEFSEVLRSIAAAYAPADKGGVFRDEDNELVVASGSGQVSVESGRALVDGTFYKNTAGLNVAIATPAGATRVDRIVLRKDFTAKTVRITRVAGTEGGGVPAITQSAGVTWDVKLAQASITTGGVITVTDERAFIPYHGDHTGESGTQHSIDQIGGFSESQRGVYLRIKETDEGRTGSGVIDTELQLDLEANEEYFFDATLFVTESAPDLGISFAIEGPDPTNDKMRCVITGLSNDGFTPLAPVINTINIQDANEFDTTGVAIRITGSYRMDTTPGTFGIRWSRVAVSGTVTMLEGSVLHVVRK